MKNLILYMSKNNTTKETVDLIRKNAKNPVDIYEIKKNDKVDLSQYSHIYIGTGVYAGQIPGAVLKYVSKNKAELMKKPISFFLHGLISQQNYQEILHRAVGKYIKEDYDCIYLGGKLDLAKQNFIIKKLITEIAKKHDFNPNNANTLNQQLVRQFVEKF